MSSPPSGGPSQPDPAGATPDSHSMPYSQLNGTAIYYEETGSGPPVVLLNGVMMTARSWALTSPRLAPEYRCILHDFRGQLMSLEDTGPFRMEQHAHDLAALLDHLEIEAAHLVGTSYGGEVGMLFALEYPERSRSLTAISCVSEVGPDVRRRVEQWADTARLAPERLYEVTVPANYSPDFLVRQPDLLAAGQARLAEYPEEFFPAFANLCDAFLDLAITARLAEIACPTLVICGERDLLKPAAYSEIIASRVPDSQLEIVPEAGHAVILEAAGEVNEMIASFLAEHD
jgi:3-oxoadipate enol-lactonase